MEPAVVRDEASDVRARKAQEAAESAWVTIDATLHSSPGVLTCLYSTDATQTGTTTPIEARNGRAVRINAPAGGFVVYR